MAAMRSTASTVAKPMLGVADAVGDQQDPAVEQRAAGVDDVGDVAVLLVGPRARAAVGGVGR